MSIFEAGIPSDEPFVVQRDALFPEDIIYSSNSNYNREESRATNRANTSHNSRFIDNFFSHLLFLFFWKVFPR